MIACLSPASHAQEPPLVTALKGLDGHGVEEIWPAVEELKRVHQADTEAFKSLSNAVFSFTEGPKLAGAAILYSRKEPALQQNGQVALQQLARDSREKAVRIAAIRLLRRPVRFNEAFLTIKDVAQSAVDPEVKIEATVTLWELDNQPSLRAPLVKMLDDVRLDVRSMAALALAETGYYQAPVDELLRGIAREPTSSGRLARALLRSGDRGSPPESPRQTPPPSRTPEPRIDRSPAVNGELPAWTSLVAAVEGLILRNTLYRDRIGARDVYLAAIRGMVSSLDEYSVFQDPDEFRQAEAGRLGTFWGLCADLVKPGKAAPLVVAKPYRGGPAFEAGLRTGDRILEVNGVTTHDRDRVELEGLTSGEKGEEVQLRILRWGWDEPRMINVRRGQVEIPSVRRATLPERIGYIKLSRVGPTSAGDFERALDALENSGMDALVIDLRDNTGGNLKQAVSIADLFIGESALPIVTERTPARTIEWSASPGEKPRHPTAILVNQLTASAAEVIAGSLQDLQRAFLVGQTTYGKGVKQSSLPLPPAFKDLLGGESRLVMTTGRLYLPSGRAIQPEKSRSSPSNDQPRGGLEPDLQVEGQTEGYQGRQLAEILRVQYSPEVDEYLHRNFTPMKNLHEEGDLWDPTQYPGFNQLYEALGTRLSRSEVRFAIRSLLRSHLDDEALEEVVCNYRDDPTLARGVLELLRRMGRDAAQSPEYRGLAEKEARRKAGGE